MADPSRSPRPLMRKLEAVVDLTPEERTAVLSLPVQRRTYKRGSDIVREGDPIDHCFEVLAGTAARYKNFSPRAAARSSQSAWPATFRNSRGFISTASITA